MKVYEKLQIVQSKLKAPKDLYNSFGKYSYRSAESILEALKPLLTEVRAALVISDKIINIGDRFYVEATAKFIDVDNGENIENTALAREDETKKGQDLSQITGSVSSYARKYALNGLFCIDDTKDSDATNTHDKDTLKTDLKAHSEDKGKSKPNLLAKDKVETLRTLLNKKGITELAMCTRNNISSLSELTEEMGEKYIKFYKGEK